MHTRIHDGSVLERPGHLWGLVALFAIVLVASWATASRIEGDVRTRVQAAMAAADLPVQVQVHGRDVVVEEMATVGIGGSPQITAKAADLLERAAAAAAGVDGVRVVTRQAAPDTAAAPTVPAPQPTAPAPQPTAPAPQPTAPAVTPTAPGVELSVPLGSDGAAATPSTSPSPFSTVTILFPSSSDALSAAAIADIRRVAIYMKADKASTVVIRGHSDGLGSEAVKKRISVLRAQTTRDFLVSRGIPISRTSIEAYSDRRPLASNSTAAGRAQNRRATIDLKDPR